jgi:sulfate/thiosulfate transport system substrate-binding protein
MTILTGRRRMAVVLAAGTALATGLTACGSSGGTAGGGGGSSLVRIVAYSTPEPAYDALEKAFTQTPAGKGVTFSQSYDSSGSQSQAVADGKPADYVAFSLEPDMARLVPNQVSSDWDANATKGIVSQSVVVLVVRKGNPKHIENWDDLTKPGVQIVTPDPASSGSAKWNILAAYEHVIQTGGTPAQASAYLTSFFKNVVSKPSSGSDALTTFENGTGDVLLSYEDEAIRARATGASLDYVIPPQDLLIQNPATVTKTAPAAASKFLSFVESDQGEKIFASQGFRPVKPSIQVGTVKGANDPSNPFPTPQNLTTITKMGGWDTVNDKFFGDPDGIVTKIEAATG